ncbi:putative RDD family membrane protein YckC [Nocardioides ginsengisegetis]|uniref:Putative RDD family membrane protein YckC n=1 Tax=Nocardioides ginsengisegetis TaxID=661491 RepID=A0A7W3IYD2_9ACTN|nr:putative RDD family membrane protein YckC [Nocardioides ginsengisegetis]
MNSLETASWARRILALVVDWFASSLVVVLILGPGRFFADQSQHPDPLPGMLTLLVFVLETALLVTLAGGSFGQLATRLRVVRFDGSGRPVPLLPSLARSILVIAVIPPLVFRPDGRGLHDLMARTATVTLQTARGGQGTPRD